MKKYALLLLIITPLLIFGKADYKKNFSNKKYTDNVRIELRHIDKGEDSLYAGLSHFALTPEVPIWERGFYLLKRSERSEANLLNNLKKSFPDIFSDKRRLTILIMYIFYNQQYDMLRRLFTEEYESYLYPGNLDQWWDICEDVRHFIKKQGIHPKYMDFVSLSSNLIHTEVKDSSGGRREGFEFHFKGDLLDRITVYGNELYTYAQRENGFSIGPFALLENNTSPEIDIDANDLDSGYMFSLEFNGVKAGRMLHYLKDSGDVLDLFVSIKTTGLIKALFTMDDKIHVQIRKSDLEVLRIKEDIKQGNYRAERDTIFSPSELTAVYNNKEKVYLADFTRDSYSVMYLLRWLLPEQLNKLNLISRKRVYPFELEYKKGSEKLSGKKIEGIWIIPSYTGRRKLKEDASTRFFFGKDGKLPLLSLSKTSFGVLKATFEKKLNIEEYTKLGGYYEDTGN